MTTMPGDTIPGYLTHTTDELLDELAAEGFHYITLMLTDAGGWRVGVQRLHDGPTIDRVWIDSGYYTTSTRIDDLGNERTTFHVTYTAPTRREALAHLLALVDVATTAAAIPPAVTA